MIILEHLVLTATLSELITYRILCTVLHKANNQQDSSIILGYYRHFFILVVFYAGPRIA
jgi:hypothetical protein